MKMIKLVAVVVFGGVGLLSLFMGISLLVKLDTAPDNIAGISISFGVLLLAFAITTLRIPVGGRLRRFSVHPYDMQNLPRWK